MDRCGTLLRCPWHWESGRYHQVIRGQDFRGMVCTSHPRAWPVPVLGCPQQGRYPPTQADGLLGMLTQLKTALLREGMDIPQRPWTMDAASVAQARRARRHQLGLIDLLMAGKGHEVCTIDTQPWEASTWHKVLRCAEPTWGLDVPSCRIWGSRPTFGALRLGFVRTSTTRSSYGMPWRQRALRGADIWPMWKHPQVVACFWKSMKAIVQLRSMPRQGDGLYTAVLIQGVASLLALRLQAQGVFSPLTMTEIMRTLRREEEVRDCLMTHLHAPFSIGEGMQGTSSKVEFSVYRCI